MNSLEINKECFIQMLVEFGVLFGFAVLFSVIGYCLSVQYQKLEETRKKQFEKLQGKRYHPDYLRRHLASIGAQNQEFLREKDRIHQNSEKKNI